MSNERKRLESQFKLGRRSVLAASLALPALFGTRSAGALGRKAESRAAPVIVNALGEIFDDDVKPQGADKILLTSLPEMVTDRSISFSLEAGLTAVNITLGHVEGDVDPWEFSLADLGRWNQILRQHRARLLLVESVADILAAKKEGKLGIIYGTQNGTMIGDRLDRIAICGNLGVRVFQLTYNTSNLIGDGSIAPANRGLSSFGVQVVERLNAAGILVDLAHSGTQTCLDAINTSQRPILISHTGCRALVDRPRNKSDEELRLLAEHGGFVGIYFMPLLRQEGPARAEDVVAHIDHAVNVCGEDHVGLGTDNDPAPIKDLAAFLKEQGEYVERRKKAGIATPGENASAPFFVPDLSGPDQFRKLTRLLGEKGYSSARIDKILGGNFMRVARESWGG